MLESLAKKLTDSGFIAHPISDKNGEKIIGGTGYEEEMGFGYYHRKFEVILEDGTYTLSLPVGQTVITMIGHSENEVIKHIVAHFEKFFPGSFTSNMP